jgi:hypothetical protein
LFRYTVAVSPPARPPPPPPPPKKKRKKKKESELRKKYLSVWESKSDLKNCMMSRGFVKISFDCS